MVVSDAENGNARSGDGPPSEPGLDLYRLMVEHAGEAILVARDGMLAFCNPKAVEMIGRPVGELLSRPFVTFIHPDDRMMVASRHQRRLAGEKVESVYPFRILRADGSETWVEINSVPFLWRGHPATLSFLEDITRRRRLEEELARLSITDELTGLLNRRGFQLMSERHLALAGRLRKKVWLLFADVDGLKHINDRHGHAAGDEALSVLAGLLATSFRESDVVARIGGDEFVALGVETDGEMTETLVPRLSEGLERMAREAGRPYPVAASFGLATGEPDGAAGLERLMSEADRLMYREKERRRARR